MLAGKTAVIWAAVFEFCQNAGVSASVVPLAFFMMYIPVLEPSACFRVKAIFSVPSPVQLSFPAIFVNDAGIPILTLDILCLDSASQCATAVDIAWKRELVLGIPPN